MRGLMREVALMAVVGFGFLLFASIPVLVKASPQVDTSIVDIAGAYRAMQVQVQELEAENQRLREWREFTTAPAKGGGTYQVPGGEVGRIMDWAAQHPELVIRSEDLVEPDRIDWEATLNQIAECQ